MDMKHTLFSVFTIFSLCSSAFALEVTSGIQGPPPDDINIQIPQPGQRNVLLIVADDMGIDLSKQYIPITGNSGATLPSTPHIRDLSKSGIKFENAWANPVCSPTRAGFLTGRHSFRNTVTNALSNGAASGLPDIETTLPELVSTAGYVSGLFGKWHLGPGFPGVYDGPRDQGFDEHRGAIDGAISDYDSWDKYENGVQVDGDPTTAVIDPVTTYATQENVDDAADWIQDQVNIGNKWVAVVAFNAPHTPLHTPTITCDGVASGVNDINAMIECMDTHIGELLTDLENMGELDKTTIIFVGDNGTDSASILPPFSASPNPSHKMNVYEGGIRVPFIISDGYHLVHGTEASASSGLGYITNPGRRESAMVHTVDLHATIAGIVGVTPTGEDSVSFLRYLAPVFVPPLPQRQYMYTDRCTNTMFQAAMRDSQYKLIYRLTYGTPPLLLELGLYDVNDLAETANLYGTGIPAETVLYNELHNLWISGGYAPISGCA